MCEYSKYSEVSPQWEKFVFEFPQLGDLDKVGVIERRKIFDEVAIGMPERILTKEIQKDALTITSFTIKARDGHDIPVRKYVPTSRNRGKDSRPVLVYLHAGGFLFGDLESGDMNCQVLASRLNISILNVAYRVAPKWPFPHGLNDSFDATVWVAANAVEHLNASPDTSFLVGGISSGATFAGVIAYTARDAGLQPPITGLFLSVPVCVMPQDYQLLSAEQRNQLHSLAENSENPMLTRKSLNDIQELYGSPSGDPRVSFLLNQSHARLPSRAYFQICGGDILRDEAFLWQKLLRKHSGTRSKTHMYSGMPHGFWRFLQMHASQEWLEDLVEGIDFLCEPEGQFRSEDEIIIKGLKRLDETG